MEPAADAISQPATPELAIPSAARWPVFPLILTALYLIPAAILMHNHAMWRDEAQAFLLARDSNSLAELFRHLRYEGHPGLWHVVLWFITRITVRPETMQILHLALAAGTVYLVARYAPFTWLEKILFPFGYFTLFEYAAISRNYQISLFLIIAFCALRRQRPSAFLGQGILLGLLCNTNIFGTILAGALGVMVLVEAAVARQGRRNVAQHPWRFIGGILLAGAAAFWCVHWLIPPPDADFAKEWTNDLIPDHVLHTWTALWRAYLPIPEPGLGFWNSNFESVTLTQAYWGRIFCGIVLAAVGWHYRGAIVFIIGTAGILTFLHIKYFGGMRHQGFLFVTAIACFWLAWATRPALRPGWWRRIPRVLSHTVLTVLLAVQIWGGWVAAQQAWIHPFSMGHAAANYLRGELRPGEVLVIDPDYIAAPVAVYLPGHRVYFTRGARWGSFTIWDNQGTPEDAVASAKRLAAEMQASVMLVLNHPIKPHSPEIVALPSFTCPSFLGENYFLYRVAPPPATQSAPASPATRP